LNPNPLEVVVPPPVSLAEALAIDSQLTSPVLGVDDKGPGRPEQDVVKIGGRSRKASVVKVIVAVCPKRPHNGC
jgi:hypothetical protein